MEDELLKKDMQESNDTSDYPFYAECHMHIFMNGRNYRQAVEDHKYQVNQEKVRENLKAYRDKGITFLRDGGDNNMASHYAKEIAGEYGIDYRTPVFAIHKNGYYGGIVGHGFDSLEEYHALVKKGISMGADFVKIMTSGILDFDCFGKVSTPLKEPELIREMIHIAHEEGQAVMVHVNTPEQIAWTVDAGCDSIEHGYYLDDRCIELMKAHSCVWVPTAVTCGNLRYSDRFNREAVEKILASHLTNIKKAIDAGVMLAPGSDAGAFMVLHGQGTLDEISILKEACQGDPASRKKLKQSLWQGLRTIECKFKRS